MVQLSYLIAGSLFIMGLKRMGHPRTARQAASIAALGMFIAVIVTLADQQIVRYDMILVGILIGSVLGGVTAVRVPMTSMPELVAAFNGFGGLSSALVAWSEYGRIVFPVSLDITVTLILASAIGAITFSGSMVAYAKLQGLISQQPVVYPGQQVINGLMALGMLTLCVILVIMPTQVVALWALLGIAVLLGVLIVLPIGGADMPVVISLLNSFSGVAACMAGFVLQNSVLIISGALVGSAGLILTQIMCKAMNRSLANVLFSAFGQQKETGGAPQDQEYTSVKSTSAEEAAMILDSASSVIMVPGYGLAVARAQNSMKELGASLQKRGINVKYAIHPVAGRMPGHMNVLLAEAEVPYDELYEMDDINSEFEQTDAVLVVGANDVTNPVAHSEPGSPIYGMPILDVEKARSIFVIKRSLNPGFAGIKNPLFENEKTMMLFGDAKDMLDQLSKAMKDL